MIKIKKIESSKAGWSIKMTLLIGKTKFSLSSTCHGLLHKWEVERREKFIMNVILRNISILKLSEHEIKNQITIIEDEFVRRAQELMSNGTVDKIRQKHLHKHWQKRILKFILEATEHGVTKEFIHEAVNEALTKQVIES